MGSWAGLLVVFAFQDAGAYELILEQVAQAEPPQARKALQSLLRAIEKDNALPPRERADLTARLAGLIQAKALTQAEVLEVLGEKTPRSLSRQVLFRRYREQWTYERPLRLIVIWDVRRGQEPILKAVLPGP